jgi:hypothetical protein
LFERVAQRGAEVVRPLGDTDYGSRELLFVTPKATCGPSAAIAATHAHLVAALQPAMR